MAESTTMPAAAAAWWARIAPMLRQTQTDGLTLTLCLLMVVIFLAIWLYTALLSAIAFPSLQNCHVLLLIAHPDDEAMFFSPTLLNLTNPRRGNVVKLLCLSCGNADGLGAVRQKELVKSAQLLGIEARHVVCLDEPGLQDGMANEWATEDVKAVLARYLLPSDYSLGPSSTSSEAEGKQARKAVTTTAAGSKKQQQKSIVPQDGPQPPIHADIILTFDAHGVSSHPNHIALHHGAKEFVAALKQAHPGWACGVAVYALTSIPLLRKYLGVVDVVPSVLSGVVSAFWRAVTAQRIKSGRSSASKSGLARHDQATRDRPSWLLYVSGFSGVRTAQRAMYAAHQSQMRWFRWGWITAGRYMYVNDLRRVA